ncbi:hypothetical protein BURPS1106B_2356 [Burkholderia pseudomallei 1106b]|nr:isrso8-transposase orfb protein [Burkholderia pseudomallei 305]EES22396.1 hypothetical protein BURPS1106B_2356 [Burkholderia pseudomallei 1106b]
MIDEGAFGHRHGSDRRSLIEATSQCIAAGVECIQFVWRHGKRKALAGADVRRTR